MRHYDDTRVSVHLLKLAGYTLPGTALGGGAGMLLGGGLGYALAPKDKKVWPTLLGAAGGGIAGAGIGGSLGLWKDLSNLSKAFGDNYVEIRKRTPNGTPYTEIVDKPPEKVKLRNGREEYVGPLPLMGNKFFGYK